ncbi:BhlA/UviB family holin-like peptide [Heliobacterium mobile]|nr:BhlA/UviB family holin-like peptide [Heliobacterium mobile]
MDGLLTEALSQGLWASLFVSLYLYQLQESRRLQAEARNREDRLTDFLKDISKQFEILAKQYERLSDDVQIIKSEIRERGN